MTINEWWKGCNVWDGSEYPPYLINAAWEVATLAERERCAKVVEDWDSDSADPREVAEAIRKGE